MIDKAKIAKSIVGFIKEERGLEVSEDTEIFKNRYVNSMFALRLLMFVEKEYDVQLLDDDLSPENFRTPETLAGLVLSRTKAE